jgi:hypothetical protein
MTEEKMREIMEEAFQSFGWVIWQGKPSIIFALKAKYGEIFDVKKAEEIYNVITERERQKREEDGV